MEHEKATFDADRYLGDLFTEEEDPLLTEALAFEPHWKSCRRPVPRGGSDSFPVNGGRSDRPPASCGAVSSERREDEIGDRSGAPGTGCQEKSKTETGGSSGTIPTGCRDESKCDTVGGSSGIISTGCQDDRRLREEEGEEGGVLPPCRAPAPVCETPPPMSPPLPPPPPGTNDTAAVPASQPDAPSASEGEGPPPKEILAGDGGGDFHAVESATVSAEDDDGRADTEVATAAGTGAATPTSKNSKEGLSAAVGEKAGRQGRAEGEGEHDKDGVFGGFTEAEEEQMR